MKTEKAKPAMPSVETIQQELGKVQSIDDFFGKEGIFGICQESCVNGMAS